MSRLTALALLFAGTLAAQVRVDARLIQAQYLQGEPVHVILTVKNIGAEAFGYSSCDARIDLTVAGVPKKTLPPLNTCNSGGSGGGSGCGIDHPPMLAPDKETTFEYLLKDYRLTPGAYQLRVSGKAGVRWKYYDRLPHAHREGDIVEGQMVDQSLPLTIVAADEAALKEAYKPYFDAAREAHPRRRAQEAIVEMAPPFAEKLIASFVRSSGELPNLIATSAIVALGEINTAESRADLRTLFDESNDLGIRGAIVEALARTHAADNLDFLASLLPGRSTKQEDFARTRAAIGIGLIGGPDAADALIHAPYSPNAEVRRAIESSLEITRSRLAVSWMMASVTPANLGQTCNSLTVMTHRDWCDGNLSVPQRKRRWEKWWLANAKTTMLYDADNCPKYNETFPPIGGQP